MRLIEAAAVARRHKGSFMVYQDRRDEHSIQYYFKEDGWLYYTFGGKENATITLSMLDDLALQQDHDQWEVYATLESTEKLQ